MENFIKTGECYFVDEDGDLCLSVTFQDENFNVWTEVYRVET